MRSLVEVDQRILHLEDLVKSSREWKASTEKVEEFYDLFRSILQGEIDQLKWVRS